MNKINIQEHLFKFGLLLAFLKSLNAWFTWPIEIIPFFSLTILLCLPYVITSFSAFSFAKKNVIPILLLITARIYCAGGKEANLNTYFGAFLTVSPAIFALLLINKKKIELSIFFIKSFAIILAPSLIIWILLLLKIPLPSFGIISHPAWDAYVYENYIFCLKNIRIYDIRFCSIFLEPGHVGMISSFLLFVSKFNFKKKSVWILLISIFFTLSLAAYVLAFISFSAYMALYSKARVTYFVTWFVIFACIYTFFVNYNSGNNIVNELIISRLAYDSSEGDLAGNNRFSQEMDDFFESFTRGSDFFSGIGEKRYTSKNLGNNAGFKVFLVTNGLIGTSLVLLFYLSVVYFNKNKLALALLVIYVFAFLQRAYPFWACELLIFATAIPYHYLPSKTYTPSWKLRRA